MHSVTALEKGQVEIVSLQILRSVLHTLHELLAPRPDLTVR